MRATAGRKQKRCKRWGMLLGRRGADGGML